MLVLPSVQCWESGHICSSEPEASRGPLAVGMASTTRHHHAHAHLCSSISFSLCLIPALEGKLLLYNLHGRRKRMYANDFCQGAGDIWNVNWSVGSFASASVDIGSVFRVRSVFKFLLKSVMFSDHWEFVLCRFVVFPGSFFFLITSPLRIQFPQRCVAPLQLQKGQQHWLNSAFIKHSILLTFWFSKKF